MNLDNPWSSKSTTRRAPVRCIGSQLTGLAKRLVDQAGEGLRLFGVLVLPSSILATACDKCETRMRLHNQLHAEASLVVYDPAGSRAPSRQRRCARRISSHLVRPRYDDNSTYSQDSLTQRSALGLSGRQTACRSSNRRYQFTSRSQAERPHEHCHRC